MNYKAFSSSRKIIPGYFFLDMVSITKAGRKGGNEVVQPGLRYLQMCSKRLHFWVWFCVVQCLVFIKGG